MHANDNSSTKSFPGGQGGVLPDALAPVADEWYRLCERRFAVDRISISGNLAEAIVTALAASQTVGNYEVQTENGPLKCSLAVYAEWQKNEEYIERLKAELAARQPVGISAEWVLGYLTTDAPEESREAIRNAFAEYAALSGTRQPVGESDTVVSGGALRMALNVLRRAGKNEVADELESTAVRQPVGQEPVGEIVAGKEVFDGERWVPTVAALLNGKGKVGDKLYAAPPAQGVDLERFRPAVMTALGLSSPYGLERETLNELLDLIDNQGKK